MGRDCAARYVFALIRRSRLPDTARRHTQVPPYDHRRTAHMDRRAGPVCPAAGTHHRTSESQGPASLTAQDGCDAGASGMPRPTVGSTRRPLSATRHGVGTAALRLTPWGLRHLRMALWDAGGVSRRARRGYFARCDGRPKALPLDSAIWAVRCPLARVVGERFFVRTRCGFAAILYVWQETAAQSWRKRSGEHRRHTGGE